MGIIRVLLAISVVISHAMPVYGLSMVGGSLAVQAFYIISGFYMSLILDGKYKSYKLFISNRLLRLYPMYWLVLILALGYSVTILWVNGEHAGYLSNYINNWHQLEWQTIAFAIATNLVVLGQDLVMFLGINDAGAIEFTGTFAEGTPLFKYLMIPQAWSISVEILFYLVAPFVVNRKLKWVLAIMALSFALRWVLYAMGWDHDPWTYRFFPTELAIFLMGNLAYRLYKRTEHRNFRQLGWGIFALILILTFGFQWLPGRGFWYLMYLLLVFLGLPFIFPLFKNYKWDNKIGELSYPIYICHLFIIVVANFMANYFGFSWGEEWSYKIIILCIIFSQAAIVLLLNPIEKIRRQRVVNARKHEVKA